MRKLKTIEMHRMTVSDFKQSDKMPLIVMLDDVRSLHNVGSVFRSGDAFRIEAVWLCGITATPPMPEIHKRRSVRKTAWTGGISTTPRMPWMSFMPWGIRCVPWNSVRAARCFRTLFRIPASIRASP